jgi:hypothetical protein
LGGEAASSDAGVGEEEGEIEEGWGGPAAWWYIHFYRGNYQQKYFVDDSDGEGVTSLYGDPGLNPSIIPLVKAPAKTSKSSTCFFFSKF